LTRIALGVARSERHQPQHNKVTIFQPMKRSKFKPRDTPQRVRQWLVQCSSDRVNEFSILACELADVRGRRLALHWSRPRPNSNLSE
jgi:hypothetical protein